MPALRPLHAVLAMALVAAAAIGWALRGAERAAPAARSAAPFAADASSRGGHEAAVERASARAPGGDPANPVAGLQAALPPRAQAGVPAGLGAEQWARVLAQLQGRPDAAAEEARLREYFEFSDHARRLRDWRQQGRRGAEGQAIARAVDEGLDLRLQRRELQAAEARGLKLAALELLVDDPAERQQRLQDWATAWNARLATDAQLQAVRARDDEFTRRRQQLVAAWSALPPAQRNVQRLEQDIAALRDAVYEPVRR
jgi:hypothetical protein